MEENVASDGGGILNFDGQVTILDSQIRSNTATGSRGQVSAKPLIAAGNGGGLLNVSGSVSMSRTVLTGNSALLSGGGIGTAGGTMEVVESSIQDNSAVSGAGLATLFAINGEAASTAHQSFPWEGATLAIRHSTISGNQAAREGGGLSTNGGSHVDIEWTTVSGNHAGSSSTFFSKGGGLLLQGAQSEVNIRHSTITENGVRFAGAGIYHNSYPKVHIGNTIIAGNQVLDTGAFVDLDSGSNLKATFLSEGNNLIGSVSPNVMGFVDGVQNDRVGGNGIPPIDPLLGPLQSNGGPTETHAPAPCSPAIEIAAGAQEVSAEGGLPTLPCHGSANPDWFTLASGDFSLPVTANDVIAGDAQPVIVSIGQPSRGGQLSISEDRASVLYSPADGFLGLESFTYAIEGVDGQLDSAVVTVNVVAGPRAMPDEQVIRRDSVANVFDVLANDSLVDLLIGVSPIVGVTNGEAGGLVEIGTDGRSILYTPPSGFVGQERIAYTLVGGRTTTVRVRVYDPEQPLRASDYHYTVLATPDDAGLICDTNDPTCPLIDVVDDWNLPVLDNRISGSLASDLLTIESVSQPDHGGYAQVTGNLEEQWIQYRPRPGFIGVESFTFVTRDLEGRTSTGAVTVEVVRREPFARIRLEVTDSNGNLLESVQPGDHFQLRVMAQDLRPADDEILNDMSVLRSGYWWSDGTLRAVQSAAIRIGFDSSLASVAGEIELGAPYADSIFQLADPVMKSSADSVELAANAVWTREIGSQDVMFASIPMVAKSSGSVTFSIEGMAELDLATFGNVPDYAVVYEGVSLDAVSSWSNAAQREDVNNDGLTTPLDALILINDLNEGGARPLVIAEGEPSLAQAAATSYHPDVDNDGWLTPRDVLVIINRLNQVALQADAEGEAAEPGLREVPTSPVLVGPPDMRRLESNELSGASPESPAAADLSSSTTDDFDNFLFGSGHSVTPERDSSRLKMDIRFVRESDARLNLGEEPDLLTALAVDRLAAKSSP